MIVLAVPVSMLIQWIILVYAIGLLFWYMLYRWYGDRVWWLALIASFTPQLFIPIIPLLLLGTMLSTELRPLLPPTIIALTVAIATLGRQFRVTHLFNRPATNQNGQGNQDERAKSTILSLMTFNCWWLSEPQAATDVAIKNSFPDIVLLQELMPPVAQCLRQTLAAHYPYQRYSTSDSASAARLGAMSRFPIESVESSHLVHRDFRVQILRVIVPHLSSAKMHATSAANEVQSAILIYNVHPRATNVLRYHKEGGTFAEKVRASYRERLHFFQALIVDVQTRGEYAIIAGDFNSTPFSDVYRLMSRHFDDAHTTCGRWLGNSFPTHTKDLGGLPIPWPIMRLDMIFCSKELAFVETDVSQSYGDSDHCPVKATLHIPHKDYVAKLP